MMMSHFRSTSSLPYRHTREWLLWTFCNSSPFSYVQFILIPTNEPKSNKLSAQRKEQINHIRRTSKRKAARISPPSKNTDRMMSRFRLPPSMAWLFIFGPAFLYYLTTRLYSWGLFRSSTVGTMLPFEIVGLLPDERQQKQRQQQQQQQQCLYVATNVVKSSVDCSNSNSKGLGSMYQILNEPSIVATTWQHDEELGRGYLLISTSTQAGKIWQWETGGGPIPIGRTLHLKDSGCRSRGVEICQGAVDEEANTGSGGIAVDMWHDESHPRLIVAEWGERRIVRLEPETGARTPLIVQYYDDDFDDGQGTSRKYPVRQPKQLLLTAFGDLLILDHHYHHQHISESSSFVENEDESSSTTGATTRTALTRTNILWQLPRVSQISPLQSLAESRDAHSWTSMKNATTGSAGSRSGSSSSSTINRPQRILEQAQIGGIALVPQEWLKLYVTMEVGDGEGDNGSGKKGVVLAILSLEKDDEGEGQDEDDVEQTAKEDDSPAPQSEILLDFSQYATASGPVVVDDQGRLYLAVDHGILVVEAGPPSNASPIKIVGHISMPNVTDPIVSMTLGGDRFLYLATAQKLYRMKMRNKPLKMPGNLVIK